ncbi:MAG: phage portal protein [Dermatophilaceae bacterium]
MRLREFLTPPHRRQLEQRTLDPSGDYPDIDAQLWARQRQQSASLAPTIREALGIPAVNRAVTMLSTIAATLDLDAFRNDVLIDPEPQLVKRPCKAMTPGRFTRDSVFYMATRGETIWLVTERYADDGSPASIYPVVPEAMQSDFDGVSHTWKRTTTDGKQIGYDPRDVIHVTLLTPDPMTGRGLGPMQLCGAALNVATEADRWAARYFSGGGMPSVFLSATGILAGDEPQKIKDQWLTDPPNMPKVASNITPTVLNANPEQAQLVGSRAHSRGDVALMFGISGRLLEAPVAGTALSYTNVGDLATELVRLTLAPYYLEQIEQAFSDLLARGTEARYDVEGFQRADAKTRWQIYEIASKLGVMDDQTIADREMIELPAKASQPVPQPLPQALPFQQQQKVS